MDDCNCTFEQLADFVDGRAGDTLAAHIAAHLETGCSACRESVAFLRRCLPSLAAPPPTDRASDGALAAAFAIARDHPPVMAKSGIRSAIARLVFDSRQKSPATAGARGAADSIRLVYETSTHFVDLWEEGTAPGRNYLIGSALPVDGVGAISVDHAELLGEDGRRWVARNEDGEFHLAEIPDGAYRLSVDIGERELVIESLRIGN